MPGYRLGRADLHLDDAETRTNGMIRPTFDLIRSVGGLDVALWLSLHLSNSTAKGGRTHSFRFDIGRSDHLGPFFGFVGKELPEIGRGAAKYRSIEIGKLRPELGIDERGVDLLVESLDDFGRSAPGRSEAED